MSKLSKLFLEKSASNIRKKLYINTTNSPYISGDTIAKLCDFNFDYGKTNSLNSLKQAKSIFCPSHFLDQFLEEYRNLINAKIIFAGNSDKEFLDVKFKWPKSVKKIFLQNSFVSDSKRLFTLPIGLENKSLASNGVGSFRAISYKEVKNRTLIGPFSETHAIRRDIRNHFSYFSEAGDIYYLANRVKKRKYRKVLMNYNLVSCPRGNGVDTHRLWETLYYGRFPLVTSDNWSRSLEYLKLPILFVNQWSIEELKNINTKYFVTFKPEEIESIWAPFWQKLISDT